jgi:hypothetical protein
VGVAEHPAGAVDVDDDRQAALGAGRLHDPCPDAARGAARDGDPFFLDSRLVDFAGLHLIDGLAALDGADVEEVRRVRGRIAKRLSGLEDETSGGCDVGHGDLSRFWCRGHASDSSPDRGPAAHPKSQALQGARMSLLARLTGLPYPGHAPVRGRELVVSPSRPAISGLHEFQSNGGITALDIQAEPETLHPLLHAIREQDEAALVFTTFVEADKILASYLTARGYRPLVLDGTVHSPLQRTLIIDDFTNGASNVLILTPQTGGVGLNLTRANHVIHYNRLWNPAAEDQATDRVHRIGQHRDIHVHCLVAANSLEDRITGLLHNKRGLAKTLLPEGEADLSTLEDTELLRLITLRSPP